MVASGQVIRASDQHPFGVDFQTGSASLGDFNNASMVDWYTGWTVPVPTWAQDGTAFADVLFMDNPLNITGPSVFSFRLVVESTNGTTSGGWQVMQGTTNSQVLPLLIPFPEFPIPASQTTLAVKVQAQRTAGSGALRHTSGTQLAILQTFFHF